MINLKLYIIINYNIAPKQYKYYIPYRYIIKKQKKKNRCRVDLVIEHTVMVKETEAPKVGFVAISANATQHPPDMFTLQERCEEQTKRHICPACSLLNTCRLEENHHGSGVAKTKANMEKWGWDRGHVRGSITR